MVEVTQADRDLLKCILMPDYDMDRKIDAGLAYTDEVEWIAKHRIAERERCAEKLRAVADSDHKRGCQGREYTCTCGFDDERDAAIAQAIREQSNGA